MRLREEFRLDWNGLHGAAHWVRVRDTGLRLARETRADPLVVELFAWLHDVRRRNDGIDRGHGERAAALAHELRGTLFHVDDRQLELLVTACRGHSDGALEDDPTVATCWDADRLDLGRAGIRPDPALLCTPAARRPETLRWALQRSLRWRTLSRTRPRVTCP